MKDAASPCPACGKPLSGTASGGGSCAYCLLQLGLSASGISPGSSAMRSGAGLHSSAATAARFVRQGVLPQFGDYELESEIARGGMGVVYRARQKSLNRAVAIKMILAGQLATPESVQRFRLEAEAAARLHHPGIVRIFEIGEYETQHFFSMELIEGVSLAECLGDFTLRPQASAAERREQQACIAELVAAVARALEFAHQRGVLHRDLKPSNILIDEQGHPHLTDFGLAKLTGRESSGLTLSSAVLGTPGYLAPEQAAGRIEQVTTAADIYGLGATLYELLTGQPPFVGSTALETMWMAVERAPTPPRQLNPAVHRDLETIALRCLEKSPAQRYASAADMADDLERFLRREPIRARRVSLWEQAWRWRQRNPWLAGMACALLLAILGGAGAALWQWSRAESANVTLTENVAHLEWGAIDAMLNHGESSQALAKVASLVRKDPQDWKAAMFAMSIMEQRRFPVPLAPPIHHPRDAELSVARLSPDGTRIATASFDGTARLWDAVTARETAPPLEHAAPVTWVEFHPEGRLVATCSEDRTVRLWDVATGQAVAEANAFDESVLRVQFSPDGQALLVRSRQTVAVLQGSDLSMRMGPQRHAGVVVEARWIAGSTHFFTVEQAGENSRVRTWDATTGEEAASFTTGSLRHATVSENETCIAWVDGAGRGWTAKFPSGDSRTEILNRYGHLSQVSLNADGKLVCTVSLHQWARVWSADTGLPVTGELAHYFLLEGARFLDDGRRLLTWGNDSLAQVWEVAADQPYCEPMRHPHRVIHAEAGTIADREVFLTTLSHLKSRSADTQTGAAQLWTVLDRPAFAQLYLGRDPGAHDGGRLSPDGRWVAIAKTSQQIHVFETATGRPICDPLPVKGGAWGLLFSADGSRLITTTSQGQVSVWSLPDGKLVAAPVELPTTYQPAEIANDGQFFVTGSTDGFVRVWETTTGRPIQEMRHGAEINAIAIAPDGTLIASAGEDRVVRVWDGTRGRLVRELTGHRNEVMAVRFAPDSRRLVTASLDYSGRVWDAREGRSLWVLPHQGEVIDAGFSPDGRWIATASRDRTAMIWDSQTGEPYSRRLLHEQAVRNVQFSPDGSQLLTLDFHGPRLWDVETCHPLTVHLPHPIFGGTGFQGSTGRPGFAAGGRAALLAMDSEEARLWRFSVPPPGAPAWFPELMEAIAGQRFAEDGSRTESIPADRYLEIERRLRTSRDTDFYTEWARRRLFGQARSAAD